MGSNRLLLSIDRFSSLSLEYSWPQKHIMHLICSTILTPSLNLNNHLLLQKMCFNSAKQSKSSLVSHLLRFKCVSKFYTVETELQVFCYLVIQQKYKYDKIDCSLNLVFSFKNHYKGKCKS